MATDATRTTTISTGATNLRVIAQYALSDLPVMSLISAANLQPNNFCKWFMGTGRKSPHASQRGTDFEKSSQHPWKAATTIWALGSNGFKLWATWSQIGGETERFRVILTSQIFVLYLEYLNIQQTPTISQSAITRSEKEPTYASKSPTQYIPALVTKINPIKNEIVQLIAEKQNQSEFAKKTSGTLIFSVPTDTGHSATLWWRIKMTNREKRNVPERPSLLSQGNNLRSIRLVWRPATLPNMEPVKKVLRWFRGPYLTKPLTHSQSQQHHKKNNGPKGSTR